jgi:hypothetical protein
MDYDKIVEEFLDHLKESNGIVHIDTHFFRKDVIDKNGTIKREVCQIIEGYKLASFGKDYSLSAFQYMVNHMTLEVCNYGGWVKWKKEKVEVEEAERITKLNEAKLSTWRVQDYENTKNLAIDADKRSSKSIKRSNISILVSTLILVTSVLTFSLKVWPVDEGLNNQKNPDQSVLDENQEYPSHTQELGNQNSNVHENDSLNERIDSLNDPTITN